MTPSVSPELGHSVRDSEIPMRFRVLGKVERARPLVNEDVVIVLERGVGEIRKQERTQQIFAARVASQVEYERP